jgi:hypothetical protein
VVMVFCALDVMLSTRLAGWWHRAWWQLPERGMSRPPATTAKPASFQGGDVSERCSLLSHTRDARHLMWVHLRTSQIGGAF